MDTVQTSPKQSPSRETGKNRVSVSLSEYDRDGCRFCNNDSQRILVCDSCIHLLIRSVILSRNDSTSKAQNTHRDISRAQNNPRTGSFNRKRNKPNAQAHKDNNSSSRQEIRLVDYVALGLYLNDYRQSHWKYDMATDSFYIDYTSNIPIPILRNSLQLNKTNI